MGETARVADSELDKLRRKGWSETKIKRWLGEREKVAARSARAEAASKEAAMPDCEQWLGLLRTAAQVATGRVGVLLCWSPSRNIKVQAHKKISLASAEPSLLYTLPENELYEFV